MRAVLLFCLALTLGAFLGSVPQRLTIRGLEADLVEARSKSHGRGTVGKDLASLLGQAGEGTGQPPPRSHPIPPPVPSETTSAPSEPPPVDAEPVDLSEPQPVGDDRATELAAARTALDLRRAQARAALIEDAEPEEGQLAAFDAATSEMNQRLLTLADELEEMLDRGEVPERRDAMEFAADALDSMLAAEDKMRAALTPEQLESLEDAAIDPFSYVDPRLVDTLQRLDEPR